MSQNDIFDGFSIVVEREKDCWKAYFVGLSEVYGVSKSRIQSIVNAKIEWEKYKQDRKKNKKEEPLPILEKEYSGRFNVRLDKELHKALVNEATQNNISLNALIYKKLRQSTVTEKKSYKLNLDKIDEIISHQRFYLFFSDEGKNPIVLIFLKSDLADILGDEHVLDATKLRKHIISNEALYETFKEFIQDQYFNGVLTKQDFVECVLVSRREFRERMGHYGLENNYPEQIMFYISRVVN
jgi:predicted HicB family RNase H-like nuclease